MEQLPAQAFIAAGAVLAAVIAGAFSFLSLVMSKEQKVSEFRQDWINSLREDICKFVSAIVHLSAVYEGHKKNDPEGKNRSDFYASFSEMHEQALSSYTAVILRVNPDEKDKELRKINDEFLRSLKEVRQHMMKGRLIEARTGCDQLRDNSIPLLKKEWERVKRGEKAYRASKVVAAALFFGALSAGAIGLLSDFESTEKDLPSAVESSNANKPLNPTPESSELLPANQRGGAG